MDKVALITGAGRGIGRACAIELANLGYSLVLTSRTIEQLQQTAALAHPGSLIVRSDVTNPNEVDALISSAIERFGRIDAVVHCAGLAPALSMEQMTIDLWRQVIDANLSSTFYLAKSVWELFKRQQTGVIVNISSLSSRDPFAGFAAYGAAKAGVNILSLVLAREGAAHGIRVHTIAPGAVETEMFRALVNEAQWSKEKTLDPAEVASIVGQCVTGALKHSSGEVIYIHKTV